MDYVSLNKIQKKYGKIEVIPPLDLEIPKGSFTVLVGPSGCGKSTLLRLIAGLENITSGEVFIDGKNVTKSDPADRGISMVFQSYALYPHMDVKKNIGFSLKLSGASKSKISEAVNAAAKILKLDPYLERRPADLSGGQRQRVAIGRSIVREPKVFLFDEPLSNLDAAHRAEMRVELSELHKRLGSTSIYVTHDQVEAMTMADQIVVMNMGRIEQIGTPSEIYFQPRTPFVAQFIGSPKINFFDGKLAKNLNCELVGVRPENIRLSSKNGEWKSEITHLENLGSEQIIYAHSDELGPVIAKSPVEASSPINWNRGDTVYLDLDKRAFHLFSDNLRVA